MSYVRMPSLGALPPRGQRARRTRSALGALPSGFTRGDGDQYGVFYYNGQHVETTYDDGTGPKLVLEGGNYTHIDATPLLDFINSPEFAQVEQQATYDRGVAQASPEMRDILTDPEWIALQDRDGWHFDDLSASLQAKIAKVPALYAQLTNDQATYDALAAKQQAADAAARAAAAAAAGPAIYLQGGILFDDAGNVYQNAKGGYTKTGATLTADQVTSLKTTGQLPQTRTASDATGDVGIDSVGVAVAPPPVVVYADAGASSTPAPSSSSSSSKIGLALGLGVAALFLFRGK